VHTEIPFLPLSSERVRRSYDRTMSNPPWYSNFPDPRSKPRSMTDDEIAALVRDPEKRAGKDYIVVDVRRTDFEVPLSPSPRLVSD